MPTRLIDSTPPPIAMSCWPVIDLRGGEVHRVEAGGAEAVDLHARHCSPKPALSTAARAMSPPASPTGSTQPSTTSSTSVGVELVAVADRVAAPCAARSTRRHLVQRAVGLAAAARGADGVVDEGVGHCAASVIGERAPVSR